MPLLVIEMKYNGSPPTKLLFESNFVSIKWEMDQNRSCCQLQKKKGSSTSHPIWPFIHWTHLSVFYFLLSVLQINLEIGLKIGLALNRNLSATKIVCFNFFSSTHFFLVYCLYLYLYLYFYIFFFFFYFYTLPFIKAKQTI